MKKLTMLAAACSGFFMLSCNKNYDCSCVEKINNSDTTFIYSVKERSKSKAKTSCENISDSSKNCLLNN